MQRPKFIPTLPSDRRHLPLLVSLLLAFAALVTVLYVLNDTAKVVGPSMEPTLKDHDRILITRGYKTPTRGDIISFNAVIDGKPDTLIKRIVAIPGDTVEVLGDRVMVNGVEPSFDGGVIIGNEQFQIGPFTLDSGVVYVLGDNRPVSLDSRFIGPIALSDVKGKVTWVFSPVTRFRRIDSKR